MSTDLRALMRSLADDAPSPDDRLGLADRAYKAGRRRRTVRQAVVSTASAIALLLTLSTALFVGPTPLAAQYGTSGGTVVSGYPKEIGPQWPVLDLPKKPGPVSGVLVSQDGTAWAVSSTGHRWRVADALGGSDYPPGVSADGRMLAYLSRGRGLVIRDLVAGSITRVPHIGWNGDVSEPTLELTLQAGGPRFAADDRHVAFDALSRAAGITFGVAVVDTRSGKIAYHANGGTDLAGWAGDDYVTYTGGLTLRTIAGAPLRTIQLHPLAPLTQSTLGNGRPLAMSSDGRQFVLLSGGDRNPQVLSRYSITDGSHVGPQATVPPATNFCGFSVGVHVVYTAADPRSDSVSVVRLAPDGTSSVATRVSASLNPACGTWAALAYDGNAHAPLVLDRLAGRLAGSWAILTWIVATGLVLALGRVAVRHHRRLMLERNGGEPRRASSWTRRRRQKAAAIGLCVVVVTAAALTPEVLRPAASQGLTAGAAVWWSEADAKQAVTGGVSGLPVAEIPIRSGHQQGYLLHLVNGSGVDQRVLGVPESDSSGFAASAVTLTVSTVDAPSDRARSLTYTTRGLVPAHQARWLRVLWVSEGCFEAGSSSSTDALALRVRLGWITRTEDVPIFPGIGVRGPSQPAPSGDRTTCAG